MQPFFQSYMDVPWRSRVSRFIFSGHLSRAAFGAPLLTLMIVGRTAHVLPSQVNEARVSLRTVGCIEPLKVAGVPGQAFRKPCFLRKCLAALKGEETITTSASLESDVRKAYSETGFVGSVLLARDNRP